MKIGLSKKERMNFQTINFQLFALAVRFRGYVHLQSDLLYYNVTFPNGLCFKFGGL